MSLVGQVGRKRWRARFALLILYVLLCLGAVTTLYPFALMASTGFKGPTDQNDNKLIPAYFQKTEGVDATGKPDDASLLGKYIADKYAGDTSFVTGTRTGASASAEEIKRYEAFLNSLPVDYWSAGFKVASGQVTSRLVQLYRAWLQKRYHNVDEVNKAYTEEDLGFQTVGTPAELLEKPNWKQPNNRKYQEWREFKATLPAEFRIPVRETHMFQEFLRAKYQNQFGQVPPDLTGKATKFEDIQLPESSGSPVFAEYLKTGLPARYAAGAAEAFWMKSQAVARTPSSNRSMPIEAYERNFLLTHQSSIRREFETRNFAYVFTYIALNGSALWNTIIFCLLAIVTQLTVNPLAAYALSRYPIRASGQILIFLLATMAFPAEVAMIPGFLLLKQLHLLNTFAALVLPTAASGYMIFLLKGFFDSLPQELFEAGQIDGAKETTMMARIALPLSKPVLGYLALLAFMGAYGAFLYAFLVVQDQRMWTLMVWIYELQNTAPKAVIMAALTIAALPTLLVFLLAQRTIMKGIVLPSER
jgi:multiple sugar transport system permease protein